MCLVSRSELERLSGLVGRPSESHPLHNSGLLSLDPVQDKTPLYSQLLQAYKWSNKVRPAGLMLLVGFYWGPLKMPLLDTGPIELPMDIWAFTEAAAMATAFHLHVMSRLLPEPVNIL